MPEMEPDAHLPSMPPGEQVIEDYRHLHLSLKAHPVSFLRADLDARGIVRHELLPDACARPARDHRRPRAGAAAAGHRQRHLHDAGGRDRHRQHHRVAAQVRAVPPGRDGRAADQRHRRAAEREGRHPHRRRSFRGSDALLRPAVGARRPHRSDAAGRRDQAAADLAPAPSALRRRAGDDAEGARSRADRIARHRAQAIFIDACSGERTSRAQEQSRSEHAAQVMPKGRNFR